MRPRAPSPHESAAPTRRFRGPPRLSTRVLVPLVATVATIMAAYGAWSLAERVRSLTEQAQRETGAYATALGIALEYAFADKDLSDVEAIIERISLEPKIYGVIVYGVSGKPLFAAAPVTTSDALAAYDAGASRLARWRTYPESADPELFAERIAFAETREYVRVVQRNARLYAYLYGGGTQGASPADPMEHADP